MGQGLITIKINKVAYLILNVLKKIYRKFLYFSMIEVCRKKYFLSMRSTKEFKKLTRKLDARMEKQNHLMTRDYEILEEKLKTSKPTLTGKEVKITKNVEDWIIEKVDSEDNGARPIIRMLQQDIEEEIANLYIEEDPRVINNKKVLNVDLVEDKISIV